MTLPIFWLLESFKVHQFPQLVTPWTASLKSIILHFCHTTHAFSSLARSTFSLLIQLSRIESLTIGRFSRFQWTYENKSRYNRLHELPYERQVLKEFQMDSKFKVINREYLLLSFCVFEFFVNHRNYPFFFSKLRKWSHAIFAFTRK